MHWRFDDNNPYEDSFEKALLATVDSPLLLEVVKRKCIDIQNDPKANYRGLVRGKLVYIAKTGRVRAGNTEIEPLLIVYTLSEREKLIRRVFICKAGDVADDVHRSTMETIARALQGAIERALQHASTSKPSPEILFPPERTNIPEDEIAEAVRKVKDGKPRQ